MVRPNDARYVREILTEWAKRLPDPEPLTEYQRDILREMLDTANCLRRTCDREASRRYLAKCPGSGLSKNIF